MTQCPQCLNYIPENMRNCHVCGFTNSHFHEKKKPDVVAKLMRTEIPMSGGGFFNGVISGTSYYELGDPLRTQHNPFPGWDQPPAGAPINPITGMSYHENRYGWIPDEKKESIFSKVKKLYHKFD